MSVQFEEQQFGRPKPKHMRQSGLTKLIIQTGLAKNAKQAQVVLAIIGVVAAGLAVYLMLPDRATPIDPLNDPGLIDDEE